MGERNSLWCGLCSKVLNNIEKERQNSKKQNMSTLESIRELLDAAVIWRLEGAHSCCLCVRDWQCWHPSWMCWCAVCHIMFDLTNLVSVVVECDYELSIFSCGTCVATTYWLWIAASSYPSDSVFLWARRVKAGPMSCPWGTQDYSINSSS